MKLMRDLVLIKQVEIEENFDGGVIVKADISKTVPQPEGTIVGVGPDVTEVEVGQEVIFAKFSAQEMEEHILIKESDIIAIKT